MVFGGTGCRAVSPTRTVAASSGLGNGRPVQLTEPAIPALRTLRNTRPARVESHWSAMAKTALARFSSIGMCHRPRTVKPCVACAVWLASPQRWLTNQPAVSECAVSVTTAAA